VLVSQVPMTKLGTSKDSTNTGDREGYLGKGQTM